MNSKFKKILLVTDGSDAARAAEQSALNLALRDDAELILVDTVRIQGRVEKWLVRNSEEMYTSFANEKNDRLKALVDQFRDAGVRQVSARLLYGKSSIEITREAIRSECDLVVRYRKGIDSRQRGMLGKTAINLLRVCPCPVLLVDENRAIESPRVLACVDIHDADEVNECIVNAANRLANEPARVGLLYCWSIFGMDMMRRRMAPDRFESLVDEFREENEAEFETFQSRFGFDSTKQQVAIKFGDPEYLIAPFVSENDIDVTVMSTIAPTMFASRMLGSTIEAVLHDLPNNLLAVKPPGFVSPVKLELDDKEEQNLPNGAKSVIVIA